MLEKIYSPNTDRQPEYKSKRQPFFYPSDFCTQIY